MAARHAGEPGWDAVWHAFLALDGDPSTAPHVDAILAHPYVHTALNHCLHGRSREPAPLARAITAAAVRAGADLALRWHEGAGGLHLPTLGTLDLPAPGPVDVTVTAGELHVRTGPGAGRRPGDADGGWRPLTTVPVAGGTRLLLDDADPLRDCYPVPVAPPLGPSDLAVFAKRLHRAHELLEERPAAERGGANEPALTTLTPLAAGTGVRLGAHGLGALGLAVDFEPEDLVRELPRVGRRARLRALRETADLNVPGNRAGRLLDEASDELGNAARWPRGADERNAALARAARALDELRSGPPRELTATGEALAAELRAELAPATVAPRGTDRPR